jgi:hypothetical protein
MSTIAAVLLRRLRRLDQLAVAAAASSDALPEFVEEVSQHFFVEETVLAPFVHRHVEAEALRLRSRHLRARLALFRLATASPFRKEMAEYVRELQLQIGEHALAVPDLATALERVLDETAYRRLTTLLRAGMAEEPAPQPRQVSGVYSRFEGEPEAGADASDNAGEE